MRKGFPRSKVNRLGRHILLTGSPAAPGGTGNRSYSGFVDLSDRLVTGGSLAGISPQLAPGLVVGDYLVVCSDYTGTAKDPYPGADTAPVALLGNAPVTPVFYQIYSSLRPGVTTVTATRGNGSAAAITAPVGLSGSDGGRAFVTVTPQTAAAFGTYIFRIVRITNVPANPAQAYSGDIYELGVTVDDAQLLAWG